MQVIPAIDLLGGKAVRLTQGDYARAQIYDDDPVRRATAFRAHAERLHVVDLEGAKAGRAEQAGTVRRLVDVFGRGVQIGGGVRTRAAFESYLALGVSRIVLGSVAVSNPELVRLLAREHPGVVIVAVDAREGKVAVEGWTETSSIDAIELARSLSDVPLAAFLYTDVARDGMQVGPNVEMTRRLAEATPIPVIASGGVGSLDHLRDLARARIGSVIVGRALYEGAFQLEDAVRVGASEA